MSMQHRVVHTTGFSYAGGVASSYNEARMTPVTTPEQVVLHSRLEIAPSPWTSEYRDYWGTQVTAFEVHELHHELTVSATSTVEVIRPTRTGEGLGWGDVRATEVREEHCEMLEVGPLVDPGDDLGRRAGDLARESATPGVFARAVCDLVHAEVRYVSGSTQVETRAADAWGERSGVCQDMAHLCLGALRRSGVPARYVSGYLHPQAEPEVGESVLGESHAWIEWWDGQWVGFDPTNDTAPDDRYVVVAHGRDYLDVAPLTGIFSGGDTSEMFVEVHITRLR